MALLNDPHTTPPDGFCYTQPETQSRFELAGNGTLTELVALVVAHRKWKGLEPADDLGVRLDIERQICASMPPGVCQAENGEDYQPLHDQSRRLTLDKIMSFSGALFAFIRGGAVLVEPAVADARAKTCRGCPFNKAPRSCSCTPLWSFLESIIPSDRRPGGLFVCGICGCSLSAKVLVPDEVIRESNAGHGYVYPGFCWQKSLS